MRIGRQQRSQSVPDSRAMVPVTDSGQVSAYRPAQYTKPEQRGLMQRIVNLWVRTFRKVDASRTTEQGSSAAASPSTFGWGLWAERYERRQVIQEVREMVASDCRADRATTMFAREAVRGGVTIALAKSKARGTTGGRYAKAGQIASAVQKLWTSELLNGCANMLTTEGDLFLQFILCGDQVVGIKRMPTSSMERLTDDTDEFMDQFNAFAQIDVLTNETVATFPLALVHHARWKWVPGERYGHSELRSVRRPRRLLELQEEAQAVRRMTRAPARTLWAIGSPENAGDTDEIARFKEENGWVDGRNEIWDPTNVAKDYFANGLVTATAVGADRAVGEIDDIRYSQDVYAVGLPTPKALMSLDAEAVNRDVLEDQRAEWLKQTQPMTEAMTGAVQASVELAFLLAGILPETVDCTISFSTSSIEKRSELLHDIIEAFAAGLLPEEIAVQKVCELFDLDDPAAVLEMLKREAAEKADAQVQQQLALSMPVEGLKGGLPLNAAAGGAGSQKNGGNRSSGTPAAVGASPRPVTSARRPVGARRAPAGAGTAAGRR